MQAVSLFTEDDVEQAADEEPTVSPASLTWSSLLVSPGCWGGEEGSAQGALLWARASSCLSLHSACGTSRVGTYEGERAW